MHNDIMAAGSKERPPILAQVAMYNGNQVSLDTYIYSIVDAYLNAKEMWIDIECLQQKEFINIQDVKTKLFWEFGKVTSRDKESIELYYTWFYRMINETNVRLVELCTLRTIVVLMGVSGTRSFVILIETPDLSQRSPQNCPKCGNPVDGQYCQGCALFRKKFNEDLFTYCIKNEILQDSSEPSNDNTNVVNALQDPFVVNQDPDKNSSQRAHYGYNCPPKVSIIPDPKPFNNQTIDELPQTLSSFDPTCYSEDGNSFTYDSTSNIVHDSLNIFNPPPQPPLYSCEFYRNDARYGHYCTPQVPFIYPEPKKKSKLKMSKQIKLDIGRFPLAMMMMMMMMTRTIPLQSPHKEPDNSLSMGDEYLDTIPATKSDEFIKSSVENLVPNPSESEGENECDVPACEDFTTFYNILFDANYDFSSSDDQSFYDEDIPKEIYSNPLFDEEIIFMKIDPHHFNAESDLIEYLLNHDSSIISSSSKIDSLFDDNDSFSLPENESFHFDIPSSSRPPTKPPDDIIGILNVKVMGDISEHKVPMPRLMITQPTLVPNQEKSRNLLSHLGHEAFKPSTKCPMMIYGRNIHILDVPFFHFHPP
nr:hypothetical protein [Tanacetum cinerariifolium]